MARCLAFVLGAGGARGALQVGALRALIEAGVKPDLLVGTSVGAINAVGLGLWGVDLAGIEALERVFQEMGEANLMDSRLARVTLRALSGRPNLYGSRRIREYFVSKGISPTLRFDQIADVRLGLVSADLDSGQPVIYGQEPRQRVLDGLMASIAVPPWFAPTQKDGHLIVDGGALSNLPVEPALSLGATSIIALDLRDPRPLPGTEHALIRLVGKLSFALSRRHASLETALAEAKGVPVRTIELRSPHVLPIWDFSKSRELFEIGHRLATRTISKWRGRPWAEPARGARHANHRSPGASR
ncbi:MAG TPA: patatin-like phospholipase family protein [Anaerolineales bacterium]|nr:patatin-like phospholipase family protein [Anaerolineales bacterium]